MNRTILAWAGLSASATYYLCSFGLSRLGEWTQSTIGTEGETLVLSTVSILDHIALLSIAVGLGVLLNSHLVIERRYRDVLLSVAAGGAVAELLVLGIRIALWEDSVGGPSRSVVAASNLSFGIWVVLVLALGSLAGAALSTFNRTTEQTERSTQP